MKKAPIQLIYPTEQPLNFILHLVKYLYLDNTYATMTLVVGQSEVLSLPEQKIAVAIDFGTTFSRLAWATVLDVRYSTLSAT